MASRHSRMSQRGAAITKTYWEMNQGDMAALPAAATTAGITFGRMRLWDCFHSGGVGTHWREMATTTKGVYNWSDFDADITQGVAAGMEISYTFGYVPQWANASNPLNTGFAPFPATVAQDFYDHVTDVVNRAAGRVKYFEVWNEFNDTSGYWAGSVALLATYAQNIKSIVNNLAPRSMVVFPSVSTNGTNAPSWCVDFINAGGHAFCDCFNAHLYPLSSNIATTGAPESIYYYAQWFLALQNKAGLTGRPVFVNEGGWLNYFTSPDRTRWAAMWPLFLTGLGFSHGWYAWDNSTYGQLWTGSALTTEGTAYKLMNNWLVGAKWVNKPARSRSTNGIRNPTGSGAVNPSTLPTNWTVNNFDSARGISWTITPGSITEDGLSYVDLRVFGTLSTTGTGAFQLAFESASQIAATNTQMWSVEANIKLQAGSLTNITQIHLAGEEGTTGSFRLDWIMFICNGSLGKCKHGWQQKMTAAASSFFLHPLIQIDFPTASGTAIDVTLRIANIIADNGSLWTADIRKPSGYIGKIIWDAAGGPTSNTPGAPYTSQTNSAGTKTAISTTVSLTGQPMLLDNT